MLLAQFVLLTVCLNPAPAPIDAPPAMFTAAADGYRPAAAPAGAKAAPSAKPAGPAEKTPRLSWYRKIQPLFKTHCIGCHGGERPKGRLDLSSLEKTLAGGKKGAPLVPGKPQESLLYRLVAGLEKPHMPPDDRLEDGTIAELRAWIEGGCEAGDPAADALPYARRLEPPVYKRPAAVTALAYSLDGALLFAAGFREILVHRLDGAPAASRFPADRWLGEAAQLNSLQVSAGGKYLLAAGGNPSEFGELQLWNVETGKLERFARLGKDTLFSAAFAPSGKKIIAAGADRSVFLLETDTFKEVLSSEVHSDWIFGAAFNADASRLLSAGRDKTIKISDATTGKILSNVATLNGPLYRLLARPAPAGGSDQFLAGGETRRPILFDAREMKQAREFESQPGSIQALAFSADGKRFAAGGSSSEIRIYDVDGGNRVASIVAGSDWVYALTFHPGGERIAVSGFDGKVRIFQIAGGKELETFTAVPLGKVQRF